MECGTTFMSDTGNTMCHSCLELAQGEMELTVIAA